MNNNYTDDDLDISYEAPLEPCPEGRHPLICVDIFRIDPEEATYDGVTKLYEKVMFVFQAFPESGERDSKGRPFQVERKFTFSMAPSSLLRPFLGQWRGRDYEDAEVKPTAGFSIKAFKGTAAWGTIVHNTRFVNIEAIEPFVDDNGRMLPQLIAESYTRRTYKKKDKTQAASQLTSQPSAQPTSPSGQASDLVPF